MHKLKMFLKSHKWPLVIIAACFAIIFVFFAKIYIESPKDLGPELKYISKNDFGCAPFPLSFICAEEPTSDYYFATNLSQDELKKYFKKATYIYDPGRGGGSSGDYEFDNLYYKVPGTNDELVIAYYDNTEVVVRLKGLEDTRKPHVISMSESDYRLAREAL